MAIVGCVSSTDDGERIASLLSDVFHIDKNSTLNQQFQQWKYWAPHPLLSSRSHVLKDADSVVAHGCIWPIQLRAQSGSLMAFHLIDWAARSDVPGAGMQVFRRCCSGMAAAFSIGGTPAARSVLQAVGFKDYNNMSFLWRPLRPFRSELEESATDWKTPVRAARNLAWFLYPAVNLPAGWDVSPEEPCRIPESLWPCESAGLAVSVRSAKLLEHIVACPAIGRSVCYLLRKDSKPVAYALLVQVRRQVRLADYGPAGLDEETSMVLGISAQVVARSTFPGATTMTAATAEAPVRLGFAKSGFRRWREQPIRVLKLNKALNPINRFRLTLMDWDALCM